MYHSCNSTDILCMHYRLNIKLPFLSYRTEIIRASSIPEKVNILNLMIFSKLIADYMTQQMEMRFSRHHQSKSRSFLMPLLKN